MTAALAHCPGCGCAVRIELSAQSRPEAERQRWRTLRDVSTATGQPVSRLRRLVHEGRLPAREGARRARLVRIADVDALLDELPVVPVGDGGDEDDDELARLMGAAAE